MFSYRALVAAALAAAASAGRLRDGSGPQLQLYNCSSDQVVAQYQQWHYNATSTNIVLNSNGASRALKGKRTLVAAGGQRTRPPHQCPCLTHSSPPRLRLFASLRRQLHRHRGMFVPEACSGC
jgi:hypothetical protein